MSVEVGNVVLVVAVAAPPLTVDPANGQAARREVMLDPEVNRCYVEDDGKLILMRMSNLYLSLVLLG